MKHLINIFLTMFVVLAMSSCSDDDGPTSLTVDPQQVASMSFLTQTVEQNLSVHYEWQRQDYGITISPTGEIDTECPEIPVFILPFRDIVINRGRVYQRKSPSYTRVPMTFPEYEVQFNRVWDAYATSRRRQGYLFKYYIEIHLSDETGGIGPYIHIKPEYTGTSDIYFYNLSADKIEIIDRVHWSNGNITLQRHDFEVAEPVNLDGVDGVFISENEFREYLFDEFERTFGERCGDILLSDLRDLWTQYKEEFLE